MAEKRMFTQKIIDSDAFLDMPLSAQALYFHLNMRADDDGFINNPKKITRLINASEDDLKLLLLKRFVIGFDSGVIVIKHWRMHNTIKNDRHTPTDYQEELKRLCIKPNKAYTEIKTDPVPLPEFHSGSNLDPEWSQTGTTDIDLGLGLEKDIITSSNELVCRTKDVRRVVEAWNSLGLQSVKKIMPDSTRGKLLKKRILDYGVDDVLAAIEEVRQSDFLQGKNNKGWMITFDWFIKPNNFPKVLDGNYRNGTKKPASGKTAESLHESYNMMAGWAAKGEQSE